MKVQGSNNGNNNGFTLIGKVVEIQAVTGGFGMLIEPMKGSMKASGEKVLVTLGAEGKTDRRPEISEKGIKNPGGFAGVGSIISFEGAKFTSEKGAEQRTLEARWPTKLHDDTVVNEDISLIHFGGGRLRALHPGQGNVVAADDINELKANLDTEIRQAIAASNDDINSITLFTHNNGETAVNFVYLSTRQSDNTYQPATDEEINTQIKAQLDQLTDETEVVLVPTSFINKSEYVEDEKIRVGISPLGVPLTNYSFENAEKQTITGQRLEQSGLSSVGLSGRSNDPTPMTDVHIYGRAKGQVESLGPSASQDQSADADNAVTDGVDAFADYDAEDEQTAGPR
jgi:hypothetical protein